MALLDLIIALIVEVKWICDLGGNMRDIFFKAKRTDNGKWICGDLLQYQDRTAIHYYLNGCRVSFDVDENTVCEYTGQLDYENEKEIYEGDLLESQNGLKRTFVVGFGDGGYFIRELKETGYGLSLTVENIVWMMLKNIGNIHDKENEK